MISRTTARQRVYRPNYNLPNPTGAGRLMTGFMTPYRHWMWKQNELWRNVHEAQFQHLRRVYRRQWFESFRVNADEYVYKYNITKAAQLAQWEHEMHEQEAKRRETMQTAQARQQLKNKHMDLLREYHERHFFYWYERASERLQYMSRIQYVSQDELDGHINKELDKYVAGKSHGYPLNFVGQLPMLEDGDGNIVEVPAELMQRHVSENPTSTATAYQPPLTSGDDQLRRIVSGIEESVLDVADKSALASAIEDIAKTEDEASEEAKVAVEMEKSDDDREVSRRKYIGRGQVGSKSAFRKAKTDVSAAPAPSASSPLKKKHRRLDDQHRKSLEQDAEMTKQYGKADALGASDVKLGEIKPMRGRARDKVALPKMEDVLSNPLMAAGNLNKAVKGDREAEKRFGRDKKSSKRGDDDSL